MGLNSYGAGICIRGDDAHVGTLSLNLLNVTIADNEAGEGSFGKGIYVENNSSNAVELAIKNCIISNSSSDNYGEEGGGITIFRTYTLCEDATLSGGGFNGNVDNTDPKIGTFENHGGDTPTASLSSSSPAINTATDDGAPEKDQRGFTRDGITDMGAYEFHTSQSINDFEQNNVIKIYPNPSNEYVNIKLGKIYNLEKTKLSISDIFGKLIVNMPIEKTEYEINISKLNSGVYFVKVETNNINLIKKLIVN